jgi:hypothetical protein
MLCREEERKMSELTMGGGMEHKENANITYSLDLSKYAFAFDAAIPPHKQKRQAYAAISCERYFAGCHPARV